METFNFNKDYILENEVVQLRPLRADDLSHFLPFALNEPDLWRYSGSTAAGEDNMRKYLNFALTCRKDENAYPFIVYDKRSNKYAGSTRFYELLPDQKATQLGYTWYGSEFQGTGLNKNCKLLLLEFAFDTLEFERVEFRADNSNERSKAAMKSIGCTVEGVMRKHRSTHMGYRRDSIILSILKSEWDGGLKERLLQKINRK